MVRTMGSERTSPILGSSFFDHRPRAHLKGMAVTLEKGVETSRRHHLSYNRSKMIRLAG
jgi:hypothetical protein